MDRYNESTVTLDQADQDILTATVSDEALEAAAGAEKGLSYGGVSFVLNCC